MTAEARTLLSPAKQDLLDRTARLAQEHFAPRADAYDREARFPEEDFSDLFDAGLIAPAVPEAYGGLGLGPGTDAFTLWMMTKLIAKADMSMARCWEGHANSQVLLAALGTEAQKARWFEGIVERGELWMAWSGEPQVQKPGQTARFGTTVTPVPGGYRVDGTKVFATAAGHAHWAILLVSTAGPGGARHAADEEAAAGLLLLACDLSDESVRFDDSWWDPIGMRGTVSYLVRFSDTFIPEENLIGHPGQYLTEEWQTRFTPHYGATFLGAAEAAYDYTMAYVQNQERGHDPYLQHRLARMAMNVETGHLWLRHVADFWNDGRVDEAKRAGNCTRFLIEHLAAETLDHAIRACGARSLNRPSPLERIYRDLSFYIRHDNADHVLATIGRDLLGQARDLSFFNPKEAPQGGP